jgi:N-acetylglutamate synthase-like GNAT family acetyltransferase
MTDTSPPSDRDVALIRAAVPADAGRLHLLALPFMRAGFLRHRPPAVFGERVADFLVAEHDERLVACAGVQQLADQSTAAVLYNFCVDEAFQRRGIGARLLAGSVQHAMLGGARRLYTATIRRDGWFERFAFRRVEPADVPASWAARLSPSRGSLLYVRDLA